MTKRLHSGLGALRWARGALALAAALASGAAAAMDGDELSLRQAVGQSNQAIQGEVLKAASAQKAVMEGLASYRAQARLQSQATNLQRDMKQSDQLCQTMATQDILAAGEQKARARVATGQRQALKPLAQNANTLAAIDTAHRASNESFCADEEVALGVCKATTNPKHTNLAGADQNAMYLFQSRSGGDTYEGSRDSGQVDAVNAYIARVVAGGSTPQQLQVAGKSAYDKNPQGRAYVEMMRRYTAFLSMASYSLNRIKESRTPGQ